MSISFNCPSCSKSLKVRDVYAGRSTSCPRCGHPVEVPGPAPKPTTQFRAVVAKPYIPPQETAAPQPLSPDLWYHTVNGVQQPPASTAALRQLFVLGQLQPTDMAWRPGEAEWRPIASIIGVPVLPLHESDEAKKKSHAGEAAGGGIGVLVLVLLAWFWLKHEGSKPGGGQILPNIPGVTRSTALPPMDIDPSVNAFFAFSDWKVEGGFLTTITCRIKSKTRIEPGLGNITPVLEFYDKDDVRLDEASFYIPSTMTEGEVIEKSIHVANDKMGRSARVKLKIKRTVL